MVFSPPKEKFEDSKYSTLKNYFFVKSKNGNNVCCFEYKSKESSNKVILWSHGNAANSYERSEYFYELTKCLNVNVMAYDYQGYGLSEGYYGENNCYDDIESIINYIKENRGWEIYLVGHSLGTGVVIDYLSKNEWKNNVVLISPYKSILSIKLNRLADYLYYVDMFNNKDKLKHINCPIKIIHGNCDELINIKHGQELYNKLSNKSLPPLWIENCGHDDIIEKIDFDVIKESFCL